MNITFFGATGTAGLLVVEKALSAGHHVTIYARNPSRLSIQHNHLNIIKGELTEVDKIDEAVKRADAVISILGPKGKSTSDLPIAQGIKHIVAGMKQHGVKRIIVTATPTASDTHDGYQFSFVFATGLVKYLLKTTYDEIISIAQIVRSSELDWTLIAFRCSPTSHKKDQ